MFPSESPLLPAPMPRRRQQPGGREDRAPALLSKRCAVSAVPLAGGARRGGVAPRGGAGRGWAGRGRAIFSLHSREHRLRHMTRRQGSQLGAVRRLLPAPPRAESHPIGCLVHPKISLDLSDTSGVDTKFGDQTFAALAPPVQGYRRIETFLKYLQSNSTRYIEVASLSARCGQS